MVGLMSRTISTTHTSGARDSARHSNALGELSLTQTIGQAGALSDGSAVLHRRNPAPASARSVELPLVWSTFHCADRDAHSPPLAERTRSP